MPSSLKWAESCSAVIVREWSEILILGAIILLCAGMTFLLQWEISLEKKNEKEAAELAEHERTTETQNEKIILIAVSDFYPIRSFFIKNG